MTATQPDGTRSIAGSPSPVFAPRTRRPPRRSRFGLVVLAVAALGIAFEVAVRTTDYFAGRGFLSDHRNQLAINKPLRPFRQFGPDIYVLQDGVRWISSTHGERYPFSKPDGGYRIVVFGGSTTFNEQAWQEAGMHYPLELQRVLRERTGREDVEVINVGFSAYSTAHSLVVLALNVLSWEPDLVVLSHNANDLSASYWPDFRPNYAHKYSHESYMGPDYRERFTFLNVLFQNSQAYWFLRERLEPGKDTSLRRGLYPDEPEFEVAAVFARNLRSFATLARERGIDVALGSQALHTDVSRYEDHMGYKPYNDIVLYPEHATAVKRHGAFNRIIAQVADETGAWFVDNDAVMHDVDEYFTDHVHYTTEGIRVLAANYADRILERAEALR